MLRINCNGTGCVYVRDALMPSSESNFIYTIFFWFFCYELHPKKNQIISCHTLTFWPASHSQSIFHSASFFFQSFIPHLYIFGFVPFPARLCNVCNCCYCCSVYFFAVVASEAITCYAINHMESSVSREHSDKYKA